jgi:peptide/nickel transport system substrate-binding protein
MAELRRRLVIAWPALLLAFGLPVLLGGWAAAASQRGGSLPLQGGRYVEGVVGPPPTHVNPLFATPDSPEGDLTRLVFSGLTRPGPNGEPEPDLANSWVSSADGTSFTFVLRQDLFWQDGQPLTADDVVFTANAYNDPGVRGDPATAEVWRRAHVQKLGPFEVLFHFDAPFEPFLAYSAAGILPAHLLAKDSPAQLVDDPFNTHPIGSGPYRLVSLSATGAELVPNVRYQLGAPYIAHLSLRFLPDTGALTQALNAHRVDGGLLPPPVDAGELDALRQDGHTLLSGLRPVYTLVYLNLNVAQFQDASVRNALSLATDRNQLVQQVMYGQATPSDVPLAPGTWSGDSSPPRYDPTAAKQLLQQAGWTPGANGVLVRRGIALSFTLQTTNEPQRLALANALAAQWRALGAAVQVSSLSPDDLLNNVLLPHKYESVLYGWDPGPDPDPFPAWHSSQSGDAGLNLSGYASGRADQLLEAARRTPVLQDRAAIYGAFAEVFREDEPAIVLFFPRYLYAIPSQMHGVELGLLASTGARFDAVQRWALNAARN